MASDVPRCSDTAKTSLARSVALRAAQKQLGGQPLPTEGIGAEGYAGSSTHAPGPATVTTAARHLAVLYLAQGDVEPMAGRACLRLDQVNAVVLPGAWPRRR